MTSLENNLLKFIDDVNAMPRMRSLLKDWEPQVIVRVSDSDEFFSFRVEDSNLTPLRTDSIELPHTVTLRAGEETLNKIFSGAMNPARAHLDGDLEVFGSDKDEVKLDAISLILWGI